MRIVKTRPKTGQFIVVWEHAGELWCQELKWVNGDLCAFDAVVSDWERTDWAQKEDLRYVVK